MGHDPRKNALHFVTYSDKGGGAGIIFLTFSEHQLYINSYNNADDK